MANIINASSQYTLPFFNCRFFFSRYTAMAFKIKSNNVAPYFSRKPCFLRNSSVQHLQPNSKYFLCFGYNWYSCILKLLWMLLFKLVLNLAFHVQILTKDTTPILPTQLIRTNSLVKSLQNWPHLATNLNISSLLLTS